jgi:hypothetical protein
MKRPFALGLAIATAATMLLGTVAVAASNSHTVASGTVWKTVSLENTYYLSLPLVTQAPRPRLLQHPGRSRLVRDQERPDLHDRLDVTDDLQDLQAAPAQSPPARAHLRQVRALGSQGRQCHLLEADPQVLHDHPQAERVDRDQRPVVHPVGETKSRQVCIQPKAGFAAEVNTTAVPHSLDYGQICLAHPT